MDRSFKPHKTKIMIIHMTPVHSKNDNYNFKLVYLSCALYITTLLTVDIFC